MNDCGPAKTDHESSEIFTAIADRFAVGQDCSAGLWCAGPHTNLDAACQSISAQKARPWGGKTGDRQKTM